MNKKEIIKKINNKLDIINKRLITDWIQLDEDDDNYERTYNKIKEELNNKYEDDYNLHLYYKENDVPGYEDQPDLKKTTEEEIKNAVEKHYMALIYGVGTPDDKIVGWYPPYKQTDAYIVATEYLGRGSFKVKFSVGILDAKKFSEIYNHVHGGNIIIEDLFVEEDTMR